MTCHSGCGPAASASNSSSTALGTAGSSSSDSTSAGASPSSTMESSSAWSAGVGSALSSGVRRVHPSSSDGGAAAACAFRPRPRSRLRLRLRRCYRRRPATLLPRPPWAPAPSRRSRPRRLLPYRAPGHTRAARPVASSVTPAPKSSASSSISGRVARWPSRRRTRRRSSRCRRFDLGLRLGGLQAEFLGEGLPAVVGFFSRHKVLCRACRTVVTPTL